MPFKPAALAKNEPFQSDGLLYGEDEKEFKGLLEHAINVMFLLILEQTSWQIKVCKNLADWC